MITTLPEGVLALDDSQLDAIRGGGFWAPFLAAAGVGFQVGKWIYCAAECLFGDA